MNDIVLNGMTVTVRSGSRSESVLCATRRVAEILATRLLLEEAGWQVSALSSADRPRRPLLLRGEKMCAPLDGLRSDERAQGFVAQRGADRMVVDACAGLPVSFRSEGDTTQVREICRRYLDLGNGMRT
jgi:hypothetical protein